MRDLATRRWSSQAQLRATSPQSKSESSLAEQLQQRIVGVTKRLGLEHVERGAPGRDERCVL